MRLPVTDPDDKTRIDYNQLNHMVDALLDAGFAYFDTAYSYHGGWSERAVRECLVKRHDRKSFLLADKLPSWSLKRPGTWSASSPSNSTGTGAGFFDFYLLYSVEEKWYHLSCVKGHGPLLTKLLKCRSPRCALRGDHQG